MRKFEWCALLFFSAFTPAFSTQVDSLLSAGDAAYQSEDYARAANLWQEADQSKDLVSADLQYNIGNAYWRLGELGEAILYWNRALKLKPNMEDAQFNLQKASELVADEIIPVSESVVDQFFRNAFTSLSPVTWGAITVALWVAVAVLLYFTLSGKNKKSALWVSLCLFPLSILSLSAGIAHDVYLKENIQAVVLQPNQYVKSAPMSGASDAFILHEGTVMSVRNDQSGWLEIRLADGKVGWVSKGEVGLF